MRKKTRYFLKNFFKTKNQQKTLAVNQTKSPEDAGLGFVQWPLRLNGRGRQQAERTHVRGKVMLL